MTELEFKISTGLKNIIGKELITDDDIAIFELVKNAYDANSKKVKIILQNIKESTSYNPAKILVVDYGAGMSFEDIKNKWLFVGYSVKKEVVDEKNYRHKIKKHGRFLAGYKGIGRFSADRLGPKLNLYTRNTADKEIHKVEMNWRKFEKDQKKEFETVKVEYSKILQLPKEIPLTDWKHGTVLEIFPLQDTWDSQKLLRLKRYLQRLINPSQDPDNQDFTIELIAKEFEEEDKKAREKAKIKKGSIPLTINGPINNIVFERLNIKTTQIISKIEEGEITTELWDKGKFIFRLKEEIGQKYSKLDNIDIHVFFLNEDAKTSFTTIMGLQPVRYGSIFLYKNGFRIHPYGDEGNDWLNLELRKAQGYKRYLSTREVIGRIEVYGNQTGFNEVSSRSGGVIKSQEYEQLTKFFIEKVLRPLERYVVEGIHWDSEIDEGVMKSEADIKKDSIDLISKLVGKNTEKTIEVNKSLLSILKDREQENIPQVIKNIENLKDHLKSTDEKKYLEKQLKSFRTATRTLSSTKKQQAIQIEKLQKETTFLKKQASEKEQLENLYHSINISSGLIDASLSEIYEGVKKKQKMETILPLIDEISIENQKIKSLYYVAKYARFKMAIEDEPQDLVAYIREYIQMVFKRRSLKIDHHLKNEDIVKKTLFVPLEISIILDNLISNSSKANAKTISFKFENKGQKLHLYVGDDGKGISKEVSNKIFDRNFSSSKGGTGIGLHHVKYILNSNGGDIIFIGNNKQGLGNGACFEVIF